MRSDRVATGTSRTDTSNSCFKTISGTVDSFKHSIIAFLLCFASVRQNTKKFLRSEPIMRQRFSIHPLFSSESGPKKDYWKNDPMFKRSCEAVDDAEDLYSRDTNVPSGMSQSHVASNLRLEYKIDRLSHEVKAAVNRTSVASGSETTTVNTTSQLNRMSFVSGRVSTTANPIGPTECIPHKPRSRSNGIGPSAHIITISGFW